MVKIYEKNINHFPELRLDVNRIKVIKDDIRNYRKLDSSQLSYIKTSLTEDEKMEIIELLNHCIEVVCKLLISGDEIIDISNP